VSAPDNQPPTRLCCGKHHFGVVCPDDRVMCCLCFERVAQDDLNTASDGQKENVCKACARKEVTVGAEPEETADERGLVCPYCGTLDRDAGELIGDSECGETECGTCEREFRWSTFTQTTYFGYPIAKEGE